MKFEIISKKQFTQDFEKYAGVIYKNLKIPKRATLGSAGYDFFSPVDFTLAPGETIKIPTGVRVLLPMDKFLMIVPRSGLGFKYKLQLDNTVGIIDSDYSGSDNEGHIWIKITNDSRDGKTLTIKAGEAIAQGIILKYELTDNDSTDEIRNGGFGSTTK
jgi:dUTP pyrophosphatase